MSKTLINLSGITKNYYVGENCIRALRGIDLHLAEGEFVAVGGPSGSGKSTMLNICGLLDYSDSGSHSFLDKSISDLSKVAKTKIRREHIGFIFQNFNLVPVLTAFENIEYPLLLTGSSAKQRKEQTQTILKKVGLEKYATHRPDRLSGGQRQRVAVARALVKNPNLVIADEPTANLDTKTANQIIDLMLDLSDKFGTTFLIATHDERMVVRCKRSLHLVDGRIEL